MKEYISETDGEWGKQKKKKKGKYLNKWKNETKKKNVKRNKREGTITKREFEEK